MKVARIGRLSFSRQAHRDPKIEAAWKAEINRRIEEIQTGCVEGIPVDASLARIRKIAGL